MATAHSDTRSERLLVWLAFRLAWLVVWVAERLDRSDRTVISHIVARLTLGFVSMVGWIIDRFPLAASTASEPALAGSIHGAHGRRVTDLR
jgi:hypothetical protein